MATTKLAVLVVAALAGRARAECRVEVAEAPADVRAAIEAWVATDCEGSLVVRVAPRGGQLAIAAAGHGERLVPDAQAAAALVASWVTPDPTPVVAAIADSELAPIGVDDEIPALLATSSIVDAIRTPHRMVAFGGVDHGMRAQLDILRGGHWVVGVAGSIKRPNVQLAGKTDADVLRDAVLYVGTNLRVGKRLHVRAQFGIGIEDTQVIGAPDDTMTQVMTRRVAGHAETAVLAGIPIGRGWGVFGGPVFDRRLGADNAHTAAFFLGAEHGL